MFSGVRGLAKSSCKRRQNRISVGDMFDELEGPHVRRQKGKHGVRIPPTPEKSQVAIGFLRNSGTDPTIPQEDPLGPIASRERSAQHSVKYVASLP